MTRGKEAVVDVAVEDEQHARHRLGYQCDRRDESRVDRRHRAHSVSFVASSALPAIGPRTPSAKLGPIPMIAPAMCRITRIVKYIRAFPPGLQHRARVSHGAEFIARMLAARMSLDAESAAPVCR